MIYLAGGAIVYGKITADGVRGVRILGRGILDGSKWKQWETNLLVIEKLLRYRDRRHHPPRFALLDRSAHGLRPCHRPRREDSQLPQEQ